MPVTERISLLTRQCFSGAKTPDVPEFSGEIPSSWANIIASLCHLWQPVMAATDTLLTAEKFAAINHALGYATYPQAEFESLWKLALQSMDHNNFGQGGFPGDARRLEYAHVPSLRGGEILRNSLREGLQSLIQALRRALVPVETALEIQVFGFAIGGLMRPSG